MIRISIAEAGKSPQLLTFNAWSITLGRGAAHELCLTGKGVSGTHCRIIREGNDYFLEDLGSTNGTYVNRQRVQGRRAIGPNDDVVLAIYRLRVLVDNQSGASLATPSGGFPSGVPTGAGNPPMMATPGPARSAPTAHVAPPSGFVQPASPAVQPSGPSVPPSAAPAAPSVQYPPTSVAPAPANPVDPANPMGTSGVASLTTSGRGQGSGRSPAEVAWEREWQQIDKLSTGWLSAGKSGNALLKGQKLKHARQWIAQGRGKHPAPKPLHREFIVAGSRARGLRVFGGFSFVMLLLGGLGLGGWYLYQRQTTLETDDDDGLAVAVTDAGGGSDTLDRLADRGNRGASDAMAVTAEGLMDFDPVLAALIATEAVAWLPRDDAPLETPAFRVFHEAMRRLPGRPLRGGGGVIERVAISADGRWGVTSEQSGDMRVWDLDKPGVLVPAFLRGHAKGLTAMEVSRDGRWLVTADADGLALRWSLQGSDPGSSSVRLEAHRASIEAVDISANGRWLVSGDEAGQVKIWDLEKPLPSAVSLPKGHEAKVTGVAIDGNGSRVLSSSEDMSVRNWRITDGRPGRAPLIVPHEEIEVSAVALASDNSNAVSGVSDGRVFLWSPTSRNPTRKWEALLIPKRPVAVTHLEISADATMAVSAAKDNALVVWNLGAAVPSASSVRLTGHGDRILQLQIFSTPAEIGPERRPPTTAFSVSADGSARSWNLDKRFSGIESRVFFGHEGGVRSVAVSGDGQWAITGGDSGLARVWDWQSLPLAGGEVEGDAPRVGSASLVARGHAKGVVAVGVDRFGRRMLTGSADGTARVWDLRNPARVRSLPLKDLHQAPVRVAAVSPDPRWGATGDDAGTLVIWDISVDRPKGKTLEGHGAEIAAIAFTPDGTRLISGSTDRSARIWKIGRNIEEEVVVLPHRDEVTQLAISGDGEWLLTGTLTEAVLWELGSVDPSKPLRSFRKHEDDITAVALGPRGRWAATGSADRRAILYDLTKKRTTTFILRGHEKRVQALAFQPQGRWLATGSDDKSIRLWDLRSSHPDEESVILLGHAGSINDLEWSPDGHWLVSAANDGTIRLWDTRKDLIEMIEEVIVLEGHAPDSVVRQVALVPGDGDQGLRQLVSASYDGTARLWPLEADALVKLGCARAGRGLTPEEWSEHIGGAHDPSCR